MKYDFILMNPPYNVGGKITKATLNSLTEDGKCVCLMPLAQYKPKTAELWRNVESFELADNEMFEDADISGNLCTCTLKKNYVDKFTWEGLEIGSFDKKFMPFYQKNANLPIYYTFVRCDNKSVDCFDKDLDILDTMRLTDMTVGFMIGGTGFGYKWNVLKDYSSINKSICCIHTHNKKQKENLVTWLYKKSKMGSLSDKLIWGTNKIGIGGSCSYAIPQIDWESISDHELWKQGDYDGAVLDVMGLKWNEDKTGVVENI